MLKVCLALPFRYDDIYCCKYDANATTHCGFIAISDAIFLLFRLILFYQGIIIIIIYKLDTCVLLYGNLLYLIGP